METHPKYGKVYNLGSPDDMMVMTERENALIFMPHPRSKGSTGFPDAIKNDSDWLHENYRGLGYRWGMGVDASETRLCEYRCLNLWDEVNNWIVDRRTPLKFMKAISEARSDIGERGKPPYDDTYGMSPVNYVKLDRLPPFDDQSPIINAIKRGDYFVTSGEVLIPSYEVKGIGDQRTITAEVEWTFPLDFVEVVWGDGRTTDRQIVSTKDLPAFGKKRFMPQWSLWRCELMTWVTSSGARSYSARDRSSSASSRTSTNSSSPSSRPSRIKPAIRSGDSARAISNAAEAPSARASSS